jgi:Uma2 family endonuclease
MSVAFHPVHTVTNKELEQLSRTNPGVRFERSAQGDLIVSPTGTLGGRGEFELARQVDIWAQRYGRGFITPASAGFTLPDGSVFAPDTAWIAHERWNALPAELRQGYARIAPDIVFELLSPSDILNAARTKALAYLRNGVRLVVLIDPRAYLAELHRPNDAVASHLRVDAVSLDPEMPDFILDIALIAARMEAL